MRPYKLLIPLGVAVAAGCAVKAPPDAATIKSEALPTVQTPAAWRANMGGVVAADWLTNFGDPQLTAAVQEAIAHNADLRIAASRVEQAMLYAKLAGAKLWPSADLLARGGGKLSGDGSGLQGGVITVSWELDLWGRVRYGRAAATDTAQAAEADYEAARQAIAAQVARAWFVAVEASLQAEIARGTVRDSEELVRLAQDRSRVGIGNDEDVFVARANVGTGRDVVRELELARENAIRALELLLGARAGRRARRRSWP